MTKSKQQLLEQTIEIFLTESIRYNNPERLKSILNENLTGIGTTLYEKITSFEGFDNILKLQLKQTAGMNISFKSTPFSRYFSADENTATIVNEITMLLGTIAEPLEIYVRITVVLEFKNNKWLVQHWHASVPDKAENEEDTFGFEALKQKTVALENEIADRTAELLEKNKALEIEAALERVRTIAMGMRTPNDLLDICEVLYKELQLLGFDELRNAMINIYEDAKVYFLNYDYASGPGKTITQIPYNLHPLVDKQVRETKNANNAFTEFSLSGKELKDFRELRKNNGEQDDPKLDDTFSLHYYFYSIGIGDIGVSTYHAIKDEKKNLLKRFRNVFDLAYQRYADIEQAEAQAKEAQIETALERVRSRTLAMQKSEELAETAAVLFQQLIYLGIEPNRLYIGIIKDDSGNIEAWATDEAGGKINNRFTLSRKKNATVKKMYDGWKAQKKSITLDMMGKELADYLEYLSSEIGVSVTVGLSQQRRVQNVAYFSKGFIGIASPGDQPEETIQLIERFTAVFNLTYTRFNDLKIAEAHGLQAKEDLIKLQIEKKRAEDALSELKATQTQLIQSEKMASLGELTAGIAHEIQNPLNFVNNFSEVNQEMVDEATDEMSKENYDEVKNILVEIKRNSEKITHHGKRADAIVKGMLQHSRSSSGVKEPTDINKLADEYLRLAYHGLRAKDKSFNATLVTNYDEKIGNINIISQDIGRVILNLITNAFYVVDEKKKHIGDGYEPTVTVTTQKLGDTLEVTVKDNGSGIPQNVLNKIFQPFFTTKPTGHGTGLGLSLSYDIVKAHGGELKVEIATVEQEGTTFIITLPV